MSQDSLHWRFWTDVHSPLMKGEVICIHVGPTGRVWLTQSIQQDFQVSLFDGVNSIIILQTDLLPIVREGRSGQIWTINYDRTGQRVIDIGRYLYQSDLSQGKWLRFEIQNSGLSDLASMSLASAINFLPTSQDRLLVLLDDRLVAFDSGVNQTDILLSSEKNNIGAFIHMAENLGDGLWITGEKGLAMIDDVSISGLNSEDAINYREFVCPEELRLRNFACPIPGEQDELYFTASPVERGRRVLVHFSRGRWQVIHSARDEDVIMGWAGADNAVWVLKTESLYEPLIPFGFVGFTPRPNWISPHLSCIRNQQEHIIDQKKKLTAFICSLAVESNGAFWVTTLNGAARYAPSIWRLPPGSPELDKRIYDSHEDQEGRLWFTAMDALLCLERGRWISTPLPHGKTFPVHTLHSLCSSPGGDLAMITSDGDLFVFNPASESEKFRLVKHPDGRLFQNIAPREDGRLWMITSDNVISERSRLHVELFDGENFETILGNNENLKMSLCHGFLETRNGELWLAGWEGLGHYANGEYTSFTADQGILGGPFYALIEMEDGKIWAGGEDKIIEFDGKVWSIIRETNMGNVHTFLRRRDGILWMASQTGIHRYHQGSWIVNTDEDGLPTQHAYMLFEDSQNRLWAGTSSGLALYDPEADLDPPQTYLDPQKNARNFLLDDNINITYSGIDKWNYTFPERLLYSHCVDGGAWSLFSSDVIAAVTGLPAGGHVFEVRVMDRNGNVDKTPARFSFSVFVPWYRDFAFQMIFSLSILIILFLIGLHVYHHFNVEKLVSIRTSQLRSTERHLLDISERERQRIGQDLHDEVVQDLTAIAISGELFAKELAGQSPERADDLRDLIKAIDRASLRTRRLSQGLAPVHLESLGLIPALRELALSVKKQFNIDCQIESKISELCINEESQLNLYRIVQESLQNAVKHADPQRIGVEIIQEDSMLEIRIEDDGKGFDVKQNAKTGMGMNIMRYRANLLRGSIVVSSQLGEGTRIVCRIPIS